MENQGQALANLWMQWLSGALPREPKDYSTLKERMREIIEDEDEAFTVYNLMIDTSAEAEAVEGGLIVDTPPWLAQYLDNKKRRGPEGIYSMEMRTKDYTTQEYCKAGDTCNDDTCIKYWDENHPGAGHGSASAAQADGALIFSDTYITNDTEQSAQKRAHSQD